MRLLQMGCNRHRWRFPLLSYRVFEPVIPTQIFAQSLKVRLFKPGHLVEGYSILFNHNVFWRQKILRFFCKRTNKIQGSTIMQQLKTLNPFTLRLLGRVVRRPVSANPGLNFNPGLFFFSSKAFSRKISPILFRVFNHIIVDKKN